MADQARFEKTRNSRKETVGFISTGNWQLKFEKLFNFRTYILIVCFLCAGMTVQGRAEPGNPAAGFIVKHVYSGVVYIDAGSSSGLEEGQRLSIKRKLSGTDHESSEPFGQVEIESVVAASAAGKIVFAQSDILPGDIAFIEPESCRNPKSPRLYRRTGNIAQASGVSSDGQPARKARKNPIRIPHRGRRTLSADALESITVLFEFPNRKRVPHSSAFPSVSMRPG